MQSMQTMKAAIYSGIREIGMREVEIKPPAPGYVTVDTRQTGICGSDLHCYLGHWEPSHALALGHETCGVVVEVGQGVSEVGPGDKVTIECFSHCGSCVYCRRGAYNHCSQRQWVSHETHGGFAEYTTAHVSGLFKLPENMSFEEGALVEPLAVGLRAVGQAGLTYQDRVAIIGGGTIGQFSLMAAKLAGVRESLITVKYDQQARLARELGADHVVQIGEENLVEYLDEWTRGSGVDAVIETVGGVHNLDAALEIVRPRGTVVLVAGYFAPQPVNLARLVESEIILTGSHCYAYTGMNTDFGAAIDLIASGKVDVTRLVSHRFPLSEVAEAFRVSADKTSGAIKVHLCQNQGESGGSCD